MAWAVAEEAGGRSGERLEVRSDLSTLARGGILNLIGAGCTGLFNFLLWVVVARKLRIHELGMFHQAVGLFTILTAVSQLGAQAGLVRTISRFRALGRIQDVRRILAVALIPVLAVGAALGLVAYLFAPQLSNIFARGADGVAPYLRVLGPLLPLAAIYMVAVSATQGFGTMIPAVVVEKIGKPAAQLGLILVAVGMGSAAMALAWGAPILLGLGVIAVWLRRLLHRFERRHLTDLEPASPKGPMGRLAREFWRFTAPRSLASIFQQTILQLDPLLIGALASPSLAGIYGTATKYLLVPHLAIAAILQVMQPKIAELLARESHERAQTVYQTATWWLIAGVWPIYLTLVVFAPFLLRIFTPEIVAGHSAVTILALAMLLAVACGPVDAVLLMGGKSSLSLINWGMALAINLVGDLLLIPKMGINGAAVAWAASILVRNVVPMLQVAVLLKLHPFGKGFGRVAVASIVCYGLLGMAARMIGGLSLPVFLFSGATSTAIYAVLVWRWRRLLNLGVLRDVFKR